VTLLTRLPRARLRSHLPRPAALYALVVERRCGAPQAPTARPTSPSEQRRSCELDSGVAHVTDRRGVPHVEPCGLTTSRLELALVGAAAAGADGGVSSAAASVESGSRRVIDRRGMSEWGGAPSRIACPPVPALGLGEAVGVPVPTVVEVPASGQSRAVGVPEPNCDPAPVSRRALPIAARRRTSRGARSPCAWACSAGRAGTAHSCGHRTLARGRRSDRGGRRERA